jgi:cytochrome c-type biogenesis protein CcmH/NrfF
MKNALLTLAALGLSAATLWADYGTEDARRESLYATFIAPCCWRENLTVHDSPAADQLRSRIDGWVAEGRSDEEIKRTLVSEFGPRILSLPEGVTRAWLFWTPFAVAAAGLALLLVALRRLRSRAPMADLPPAALPDHWDAGL